MTQAGFGVDVSGHGPLVLFWTLNVVAAPRIFATSKTVRWPPGPRRKSMGAGAAADAICSLTFRKNDDVLTVVNTLATATSLCLTPARRAWASARRCECR